MKRGPNPMHAYLRKTDPRLLCGETVGRRRRVLVPLAMHALRADDNTCGECLREAERLAAAADQERAQMFIRKHTAVS